MNRISHPEFWRECVNVAREMGYAPERAEALADAARPPLRYAGFDPSQPRDEEGRWVEAGGFHVQVDKGDIIRKGGHVGLHGKHLSEVPAFMEQLKGGTVEKPKPAEAKGGGGESSTEAIAPELVQAIQSFAEQRRGDLPTHEAYKSLKAKFPSLTPEQFKSAVKELHKQGVVTIGNANMASGIPNEFRIPVGSTEEERASDPKFVPTGGYLRKGRVNAKPESQPAESSLTWGPRQHAPERVKNAVQRLKDLDENLGSRSYEDIEQTIASIAKEFDAGGLKEVAQEFGVRSGLTTKANTVRKLAERISERKGHQERGDVIDKVAEEGKKGSAKPGEKAATAEHPLAGIKDGGELLRLINPKGGPLAQMDNPNPLGYDTRAFPEGVDPAAFTTTVKQALDKQRAANPFQRQTLPQVYNAVKASQPGLSYFDFQSALAKMQADKQIRLAPYTQAVATHPDPKMLMPLDRELKWFVEPA